MDIKEKIEEFYSKHQWAKNSLDEDMVKCYCKTVLDYDELSKISPLEDRLALEVFKARKLIADSIGRQFSRILESKPAGQSKSKTLAKEMYGR